MNDEEFGFLARLLCRQDGVESEAVGNILWEVWDSYGSKTSGDWRVEDTGGNQT